MKPFVINVPCGQISDGLWTSNNMDVYKLFMRDDENQGNVKKHLGVTTKTVTRGWKLEQEEKRLRWNMWNTSFAIGKPLKSVWAS